MFFPLDPIFAAGFLFFTCIIGGIGSGAGLAVDKRGWIAVIVVTIVIIIFIPPAFIPSGLTYYFVITLAVWVLTKLAIRLA